MEEFIRTLNFEEMDAIEEIVPKIINEVIQTNIPYKWECTEEPFINLFGKLCFDRSGDVVKMKKKDLIDIDCTIAEEGIPFWAESELQYFLDSIKINRWEPTYVSNHGKHWITYMEVVWSELEDWKYSNFELSDENGEEINEELEQEINDLFYELIKSYSYKIYYARVLRTLK
ncbi:hypothetical protein QUF88_13355 [Bacillus sp. DX1.1]|uniref:hypothetical protein n=1 Tax=unclassified Bacillus (in: firmicutes) TaxID=185979 RepID=UPI002570C066|nr:MULTISPECIES: hypothetical protein [unclassified Bacillus (in: firmicutes)]MDM5154772.1 hypothetical protein [Bacillus sp. DX1.1]WJE83652.1 hypothetical protein QRE67_10850 [Bacillus sp. DX3.1]